MNADAVRALLDRASDDEVSVALDRALADGHAPQLVDTILALDDAPSRGRMFAHLLRVLPNAPEKAAMRVVGQLLGVLDTFDIDALVSATESILQSIYKGTCGQGAVLELLPRLLSILSQQPRLAEGGADLQTGAEFVERALQRLCEKRWPSAVAVRLTTVLRDSDLADSHRDLILHAALRHLGHVDIHELPSLTYQILLLARKPASRQLALKSILAQMDSLSRQVVVSQQATGPTGGSSSRSIAESDESIRSVGTSRTVLRQVQGNCLLHINFAIKQDHELGQLIIKVVRSLAGAGMTSFNMALLLSVALVSHFEDAAIGALKSGLWARLNDDVMRASNAWLAKADASDDDAADADATVVLRDIVASSADGWDHVLPAFVRLGACLVDAYAGKLSSRSMCDILADSTDDAACTLGTANDRAFRLGLVMLHSAFAKHEQSRGEILSMMSARLLNRSPSAGAFVALLRRIVATCPHALLEQLQRVRDMIDILAYLPLPVASAFLAAIRPVITLNVAFQDHLVLVLRKAIFAKEMEARKVAVAGVLMLLGAGDAGAVPQFSQRAFSQDARSSAPPPAALSAGEVLAILRRCLSQQPDVRLSLYVGLHRAVTDMPHLAVDVLSVLEPHFSKYFDPDGAQRNPFRTSLCLEQQSGAQGVHTLVEPLPQLLAVVCRCVSVSSAQAGAASDARLQHLGGALREACARLSRAELDDFGLSRASDMNPATAAGSRNLMTAATIVCCIEVLMEFVFSGGERSMESCNLIVALFHRRDALMALARDAHAAPAAAPATAAATATAATAADAHINSGVHSIEFAAAFCRFMFSDNDPHNLSAQNVLRAEKPLLRMAAGLAVQCPDTAPALDAPMPDRVFVNACLLGRTLVHDVAMAQQMRVASTGPAAKEKRIASIALEGFLSLFESVVRLAPSRAASFLVHTAGSSGGDDSASLRAAFVYFQEAVVTLVVERVPMYREAGLLVGALESLLAGGLLSQPLRTELLAGMSAWLATLCEDQNIDDLSFARVAFQFLFSTAASSADLAVLRNAVRDARRLLGDIFEKDGDAAGDDDIRGDGTVQMAAVNAKTVVAVSALAVGGIDALLAGAEWGLSYARALDAAHTDAEDGAKGRAARIVAAVSERTTRAVELLSELLQAIMTGAGAEALLRALTRACKLVLNIAKWYGKNAHAAAPSKEFVALIDLVLGRLTDDAYQFIPFWQTSDLENARLQAEARGGVGGDGKGKRKKGAASNAAQRARISRESKLLPNLIFSIEHMERQLVQLAKATKVNLLKNWKRGAARDFRIQVGQVAQVLQAGGGDDGDGDDAGKGPAKRARTDAA